MIERTPCAAALTTAMTPLCATVWLGGLLLAWPTAGVAAPPETVHFPSEDRQTELVGYLFEPQTGGAHPAVVLLHGRAGPYSSLAKGVYTAETLSQRHLQWGRFWAERGYVALLVDSFGPRGFPEGFPRGSYEDRPATVSEQTVRPLDAYGALRYLRGRGDVLGDRVGVQGWSNGGMTVLAAMSRQAPGIEHPSPESGFRAALAEYPGCGMDAVKGAYRPYAPLLMMLASADEEVSPKRCQQLAERVKNAGGDLQTVVYDGAAHNYDDPGKTIQSNPANRRATEDTMRRAESFFALYLRNGNLP
jgi:dienelactone hydrolase